MEKTKFGYKDIDQKDKKSYGKALNDLKKEVNHKIELISKKLKSQQKISNKNFDLSRPGFPFEIGSSHPISIVKNKIIDIFSKIIQDNGFLALFRKSKGRDINASCGSLALKRVNY